MKIFLNNLRDKLVKIFFFSLFQALRWVDYKCDLEGLECSGHYRREKLGSALYKIRVPLIGQKDMAEKIGGIKFPLIYMD